LFGSINLSFLLRENLAAVLIIPSSWDSQLDGDLYIYTVPHQSTGGLEHEMSLGEERVVGDNASMMTEALLLQEQEGAELDEGGQKTARHVQDRHAAAVC
jgi:hypothetical protein